MGDGMVRSCCRTGSLQPLVPRRQLAYQSIRVRARGVGGEMFFLGRGPPVPEHRKRRPVPPPAPLPRRCGAELHPPQSCEIRAQRTAPRPHPFDQHHRRGFQSAWRAEVPSGPVVRRIARARRATAARSPARAAGPPRRTVPRAWPDRPAAVRARHRARPRGGTRGCSCPILHGRRRRSAGPVRRTAPGCSAGRRGARGRSCGPAYEPVGSNRRSRQWTRPILVRRHTAIRWPDPAATRNSWRTVVHPQPHSAYDRGFAHEPTDLTQNCADRRARGGNRRRNGVVRRLRSRRDPGRRPARRGCGSRFLVDNHSWSTYTDWRSGCGAGTRAVAGRRPGLVIDKPRGVPTTPIRTPGTPPPGSTRPGPRPGTGPRSRRPRSSRPGTRTPRQAPGSRSS